MNIYPLADPAHSEENPRAPRFIERATPCNRLFDMDQNMMGVFRGR